jgi:hypothetical protein
MENHQSAIQLQTQEESLQASQGREIYSNKERTATVTDTRV